MRPGPEFPEGAKAGPWTGGQKGKPKREESIEKNYPENESRASASKVSTLHEFKI